MGTTLEAFESPVLGHPSLITGAGKHDISFHCDDLEGTVAEMKGAKGTRP